MLGAAGMVRVKASLKGRVIFTTGAQRITEVRETLLSRDLLLQDRAVAVADEPRSHGFRIFDFGERAQLNAKQLV